MKAEEAAAAIARLEAVVRRASEALAAERERSRELAEELEATERSAAQERAEIGDRVEALAEGLESLLAADEGA